jgi:hypothetical protein
MITSPDGKLLLSISDSSANDGGIGGMGHDSDDYFQHTFSVLVYDAASKEAIFAKTWTEYYNADDGSSSGERPKEVVFSDDSTSLVARFARSNPEVLPLPKRK